MPEATPPVTCLPSSTSWVSRCEGQRGPCSWAWACTLVPLALLLLAEVKIDFVPRQGESWAPGLLPPRLRQGLLSTQQKQGADLAQPEAQPQFHSDHRPVVYLSLSVLTSKMGTSGSPMG